MKIQKYQAGGPAPAPAPMQDPNQGGGQDPLAMMMELAMAALQGQDCNAAMELANMVMQLVQSSGAPQGPVGEAPQGQPVFKRGGKMVGRKKNEDSPLKKLSKGGKGKC